MSTSTAFNKAFYRAFALAIAVLSIGILILALLVTTSGPWVRQVLVQNQNGDGIASVDQGLTVVFDRPINSSSTDFASAIEVKPKTDLTVSHRNQQLNITFNQNLLTNTDYVLTVRPTLEDDLGKQMEREYTYKFATAEPSFTYLERNYGPGAVDRVIERVPLSQKSHVLFGADKIKFFARNASYLAVVVPRADNTDELRVLDLGTHEEKSVDLPPEVRIDNLKFSPVDNQFVFIAHSIPKADASEYDPEAYGDRLYRYDIEGEQVQLVDTLSDERSLQNGVPSREGVLYSGDGQALLYQKLDGEFYLTGATQTTAPVLLGKYKDSGGFDRTNTKLTFPSGSGAAIYDAQAGETQEVPDIQIGGRISTPMFLHNSDELLYIKDPLGAKAGETLQVNTTSVDGKVEEQVVDTQAQASFFGEPEISYDDRYVLIEVTFESQGSDDYVGNRKPKDPRIVLYDRLEGKVIDSDTRGIDPVWNR